MQTERLGEDVAKTTQRALESDPAPPFDAGTPEKPGPKSLETMQERPGPTGETRTPLRAAAAQDLGSDTPVADQ